MTVHPEVPDLFDASGAFETCRVRQGKVLHLEGHLNRLRASLNTLGFSPSEQKKRMEESARALKEAAAGLKEGSVRIAVRRWGEPRLLVHRREGAPYPPRLAREGVSIRTVAAQWPQGEPGPAQAKASERLAGVLARWEGGGSLEVLRIGAHGFLTEGTVSNLFMVKDGTLQTPPAWLGVLEGVTRDAVMRAARRSGIPVLEAPFSRHELFNADEAFLTNALMGILPIRRVDGRPVGRKVPGPVTRRLQRGQVPFDNGVWRWPRGT